MDLSENSKNNFVENIRKNRTSRKEKQEVEEKRQHAAIVIQRNYKGFKTRKKFNEEILKNFNELIPTIRADENVELKPSIQVFRALSQFLLIWKPDKDPECREKWEKVSRYLLASIESDSLKFSYISVALNKEHSLGWIRHMKKVLYICCSIVDTLKPENHQDTVTLALMLRTLVAFTCPNSWIILRNKQLAAMKPAMQQICNNILGYLIQKGFLLTLRSILIKGTCKTVATLKPISLNAVITLAIRPLINANFSENLLSQFLTQILSIPALVFQLEQFCPDMVKKFQTFELFEKCLNHLYDKDNFKIVAGNLQGAKLLALTANLIQMYNMESLEKAQELAYPQIILTMKLLFETIPDTVEQKGTCSQWHELLGWYNASKASDTAYENLSMIKKQVNMLWGHKLIKILLGDYLKSVAASLSEKESSSNDGSSSSSSSSSIIKKAIEFKSGIISKSKSFKKLFDSFEIQRVATTCSMYFAALVTLPQLKLDILSGICYNGSILKDLWTLINSIGMKGFIDLIKYDDINNPPGILLLLFCDSMTHYVTILDDMEMYDQQLMFTLQDYIVLSHFLNNLLFKTVNDNIYDRDVKLVFNCPLFVSMHTLLLCLYRRDNRRKFAPENHWIIKEIKPAYFLMDLEKGGKSKHAQSQLLLQKMPHIISHQERVSLFRKYVQNEKAVLGLCDSAYASSSALVTVHRDRIVEDGYRNLAALPARALKGIIRVRFINIQGLDEAGIDQDGVFKEFLEETIKRVFDPSLNLFKVTAENRLYPSPTSYLQENHLQYFEFVGRMLGKAVYEGILVDVPFASFFLSLVLGQTQQALYSCIDELGSLDNELYKSLTFIKHYEGDVSDLDLTFSLDEEVMGKVVNHELFPGGRLTAVTNENRINYIHSMAFFRMHTQICEQTSAFIRGFRSIINPDWLALFSTNELQRLISGDTSPLDLKDLRRNTQYFGGFHDSHRVINWLWDILAKDFTEEERRLFLKFVTSCSRPPLLGFSHMEPQFSIRCVEVSEEEDVGDTIGSVIRGFFTIRKKEPLNRLPTSSTCFNLLKLPNYQKKATLRDKLRYAISSNTGFELS